MSKNKSKKKQNSAVKAPEAKAPETNAEKVQLTEKPHETKAAPAEAEKAETVKTEKKEAKKYGYSYFLRIAGILTLICSAVALLLSAVNLMTADKIAANTEEEKKKAVAEIFPGLSDTLPYSVGNSQIYLVFKDDMLYGYCANVSAEGYGGTIEMMVGVGAERKVEGVKIVSMSETAGLGSKTKNDSFLSQFSKAAPPYTVGENIDAVAGASISSRAVTAGVNSALEINADLETIAAQNGYSLWGADSTDESTEETETTASPENSTSYQPSPIATAEAAEKETNISPDNVGIYPPVKGYYGKDSSYTGNREQGYYIEKETTDTEETSAEGITG